MSRIGNTPIQIPNGVTVEKTDSTLMVSGPKGVLEMELGPSVKLEITNQQIIVTRKNNEKRNMALHGLTRSLIANMVVGVTEGWSKNVELVGVGFRAQGSTDKVTLNVGYSHPVEITAPVGIEFMVTDNTKIKISGIDKYLVGQVAANIRGVRPPDVYKGKGVRYAGEYVRKKPGKAGKVGAGAAK